MIDSVYVVTRKITHGRYSYEPWSETCVLKAFRRLADAEDFEKDCYESAERERSVVSEFTVEEVEFEEA